MTGHDAATLSPDTPPSGAHKHTSPPPARRPSLLLGPYTLRQQRRAAGAALFFLWFIIITGATVRLTGSGLGCPNWPTCTTTRAVPELEYHAMIEFLNRMTSTPTLICVVLSTWIAFRLAGPVRRDLRWTTMLCVIGVLVQAGVGALTVILKLPPIVVSIHFVTSIAILLAATWAFKAAAPVAPPARWSRSAGVAGAVLLVSLALVIAAGIATTASGPHSGASGDMVVERFNVFKLAVMLHARGAYVFLGALLVLGWWRMRAHARMWDVGALVVFVAIQITLGEIQYRTGLPWGVVLAHVANAAIVWMLACSIAIDAWRARSLRTPGSQGARDFGTLSA